MDQQPEPVSRVDERLRSLPKEYHSARWYVVGTVIGVLLIAVGLLAAGYMQQRAANTTQHKEITASCDFWKTLGELPVMNAPGANAPTKTGVALLAESRNVFIGADCEGMLAPPSEMLIRWVHIYHLPLLG